MAKGNRKSCTDRFKLCESASALTCADWTFINCFKTRCSSPYNVQCESKKSPLRFSEIFPKRLGIFNQFFTHLLYDPFYTRSQIFIQIPPTLTKLCHTKRKHPANFHISLELQLLSLLTEQMTSLLTSCHIQHVC